MKECKHKFTMVHEIYIPPIRRYKVFCEKCGDYKVSEQIGSKETK